jgi:hypothetical protein
VLYVQHDVFRVFPPSQQLSPADYTGLRGQLDFWERYLELDEVSELDPAVRAEVEAKVAALRATLAAAGV